MTRLADSLSLHRNLLPQPSNVRVELLDILLGLFDGSSQFATFASPTPEFLHLVGPFALFDLQLDTQLAAPLDVRRRVHKLQTASFTRAVLA